MALTCIQSNDSLHGLCGRWQCSDKRILYNGNKKFHLLPLFGFLYSGKEKTPRNQNMKTW